MTTNEEMTDLDVARHAMQAMVGKITSNTAFVEIGMACKNIGMPDDEIDYWMKQSDGYDSTVRSRIRSFRHDADGYMVNSCVYWAQQLAPGYKPPRRVNLGTYPEYKPYVAPTAAEPVTLPKWESAAIPQHYANLSPIEQLKAFIHQIRDEGELSQIRHKYSGDGWKTDLIDKFQIDAAQSVEDIEKALKIKFTADGGWIAANPCLDENAKVESVSDFRYLVWEGDNVPLEEQWGNFVNSRAPIVAVTFSGGKSLHAIIKIGATSSEDYQDKAKRFFEVLKRRQADFDPACKNPNRLTRLPGIMRGDNLQSLVALKKDFPNSFERFDVWLRWQEKPKTERKYLTGSAEVSYKALTSTKLPEPLIKNLITPRSFNLIAGDSKAGKSWLLINFAICCTLGIPWLGLDVKEPMRVEYVNTEIDQEYFEGRLDAALKLIHATPSQIMQVHHFLRVRHTRGLTSPMTAWGEELIDEINEFGAKISIVDPLYMVMEGDENSAQDVKPTMHICNKIIADTESSLMASHHHRKGDMTALDIHNRIAGSGVFSRAPDTIIDLSVIPRDHLLSRGIDNAVDDKERSAGLRFEYMNRNLETPAPNFFWRTGATWKKDTTGFLKGLYQDPKKYDPDDATLSALRTLLDGYATFAESLPDQETRHTAAAASSVKVRIVDALKGKGEPQTVAQLASLVDAAVRTVQVRVKELLDEGILICANPDWSSNDPRSAQAKPTYYIA